MELVIISPAHKQVLRIAWLELQTTVGNFVIQPGHATTVLLLAPASIATMCLHNGKQETVSIPTGLAQIARDSVTLMLSA